MEVTVREPLPRRGLGRRNRLDVALRRCTDCLDILEARFPVWRLLVATGFADAYTTFSG